MRLLLFFKKLSHGDLSQEIEHQSKIEEASQPEDSENCEVFKVQLTMTHSC